VSNWSHFIRFQKAQNIGFDTESSERLFRSLMILLMADEQHPDRTRLLESDFLQLLSELPIIPFFYQSAASARVCIQLYAEKCSRSCYSLQTAAETIEVFARAHVVLAVVARALNANFEFESLAKALADLCSVINRVLLHNLQPDLGTLMQQELDWLIVRSSLTLATAPQRSIRAFISEIPLGSLSSAAASELLRFIFQGQSLEQYSHRQFNLLSDADWLTTVSV
jgi:hypothetical protein